jgi:hypothetical protein
VHAGVLFLGLIRGTDEFRLQELLETFGVFFNFLLMSRMIFSLLSLDEFIFLSFLFCFNLMNSISYKITLFGQLGSETVQF